MRKRSLGGAVCRASVKRGTRGGVLPRGGRRDRQGVGDDVLAAHPAQQPLPLRQGVEAAKVVQGQVLERIPAELALSVHHLAGGSQKTNSATPMMTRAT
jgi:hypothetical protein